VTPADVVGPVCESSDTFATGVPLPPLEPGDLVALLDAGAYGSVMASAYNGRPSLAQVVSSRGELLVVAGPGAPASASGGGVPLAG
jgi:diaminopimelate decarboxylase